MPKHWYDTYDHIGYSVKGQKVDKPDSKEEDEVNKFIEKQNDKGWWLKIKDELNNRSVRLSREDLEILQRIKSGKYADPNITE